MEMIGLTLAPLNQLTKTTAQVANWTSDTVNAVAQNAKQMADEAYVEMNKNAAVVSCCVYGGACMVVRVWCWSVCSLFMLVS